MPYCIQWYFPGISLSTRLVVPLGRKIGDLLNHSGIHTNNSSQAAATLCATMQLTPHRERLYVTPDFTVYTFAQTLLLVHEIHSFNPAEHTYTQ